MSEISLIGKNCTLENLQNWSICTCNCCKTEKARIIQLIDEDKRGYKAVQVGFENKPSKMSKAMKVFLVKILNQKKS